MPALLQAAILIEKGNIWVGDNSGNAVDLGSVRKVRFTGKQNIDKVQSDNRGTIVNKDRINGEFEFDWLECASISNIENMFRGVVTKSSIAGSSTPVTGEVMGASGAWAYLQPMWFLQQDSAQVVPTAITVTGSVDGALTVNTSYFVVQDAATKRWGIYIKSGAPVTTLNQNITVNYTSTPATALKLVGGTSLSLTSRYMKIVGTVDGGSKTRILELASCTPTSDLLLNFVDVETAKDVGVMPVKVESDKGTLWTYTDQVNPN